MYQKSSHRYMYAEISRVGKLDTGFQQVQIVQMADSSQLLIYIVSIIKTRRKVQ